MNAFDQHLLAGVNHIMPMMADDLEIDGGGVVRASVEILDPILITGEIDKDAKPIAQLTVVNGDPGLASIIYGTVLRDNAARRSYTVRTITEREIDTILRCSITRF